MEDRQKIGATVAEPVKEDDRVAVLAARLNNHRRLQVGSGTSGVAIFVAAADPHLAQALHVLEGWRRLFGPHDRWRRGR